MRDPTKRLLARVVSIDVEAGKKTNRIWSFAGFRSDPTESFVHRRGNLPRGLELLDKFSEFADFVVGHKFIDFDRPLIDKAAPGLSLLAKPVIDTLWLSPLAFPSIPYHRLVKHYQDGGLQRDHGNDPELDAELVLILLADEVKAFRKFHETDPDLCRALHYLVTTQPVPEGLDPKGFDEVFRTARGSGRPSAGEAVRAIRALLTGKACEEQVDPVVVEGHTDGWPLAYALSWIMIAGGGSVMPPWVLHQFPAAGVLVDRLRDTPCGSESCEWCREQHDPRRLLKRWFDIDGFRPKPAAQDGTSLQEVIATAALEKKPVLGILPTGTGKSICYQLPALAQFERTGALTVVVSPLVALMADQVEGMRRQGIESCVTVNGMLSLPKRHEELRRVGQGDAAILLISPEQLRSPSVRSALRQRKIGYWVIDEAHCVSEWGHDFRPDYRYVARFIRERSDGEAPPPIVCLTATAKPGVVQDILRHVHKELGVEMTLVDGGSARENLDFLVVPAGSGPKFDEVAKIVHKHLSDDGKDGAIVYCSTRNGAEELSKALQERGLGATHHYHSMLKPEDKKAVQARFTRGDLQVVVATNAFGMGIDKPDVRLVVHADIPGSLENYVQEAGRAGRDGKPAHCVLMYDKEDVERQFWLSGRSRLAKPEIGAILKSLRRLDGRTGRQGEVVATSGEIVREERDDIFNRDSATDDTRVRTAVSWLEEAKLLRRDENKVRVFPSSLIKPAKEARRLINEAGAASLDKPGLVKLVQALASAPPDAGISTDELAGTCGFSPRQLRDTLERLEELGISSNDTAITVFVHLAVPDSSRKRLIEADSLEGHLVDNLRELHPDLEKDDRAPLDLRLAAQKLRDDGHATVRPDIVERLVRSIAGDGGDDGESKGSLFVRKVNRERLSLRLQRSWEDLAAMSGRRRRAAKVILGALLEAAPDGSRGKDIQVETTLDKLKKAIDGDIDLKAESTNPSKLLDRALLWLHEMGIVTLGKGLTVFRQAMTIKLEPGSRKFTKPDYEPLERHYEARTVQTNIMKAYAERGLESMNEANRFSKDYFALDEEEFERKWLAKVKDGLKRQTTQESWHRIVESLGNRVQKEIVRDVREATSVLVLAGPGSGKTRVLVHRIAYLVRGRREDPSSILALVYNRHAAVEIRRRLADLIGDDARGVTVMTCHGFAMRVVGASFAGRAESADAGAFDDVLDKATALLRGDGLAKDEAEAQRDTLISGYRWILVDEYQDVGKREYELIKAIAGRAESEEDARLSLFAVGDDDQNIYSFRGASVEYIRKFEEDYGAKSSCLLENYRSTRNIVRAANAVISPAAERMKAEREIVVNADRRDDPPGGALEGMDPVGRGRVQVLGPAGDARRQAVLAVDELQRLAGLVPDWDWARAAVIAREWKYLDPVRSLCGARGIPVQVASEDPPGFWRLRETQALAEWLRKRPAPSLPPREIADWVSRQDGNPWWDALGEAVEECVEEWGDGDVDRGSFLEWLAEWGRDARLRQDKLLLLTAHRAKGLEFDDVVVLDGGWDRRSNGEDPDASRRLFYVAMSRARRSLALARLGNRHDILAEHGDSDDEVFLTRPAPDDSDMSGCGEIYRTLGLKDVDLGFAGRLDASSPSLGAIGRLKVGDPLFLKREDKATGDGVTYYVLDREGGTRVGRLASACACKLPSGARFVRGSVHAIVVWKKDDAAKQEYRDMAKRDEWETVVPELVFEGRA